MRPSLCASLLTSLMSCALACGSGSRDTHEANSDAAGGATTTANGGSVASASGGSTGILVPSSGGAAAGVPNCGFQRFDSKPLPADVLLVLDRSASMQDKPDGASASTSKWELVVPAVSEVIGQTGSRVSWGMKSFPEGEGSECVSGSVTSKIDVEIADDNSAATLAQLMVTQPNGNGTPTGDAIAASVAYLQGKSDGHKKYLLLATDGEPSCAGTTKNSGRARSFATEAVEAAFDAGFSTYVVGVATTKDSATQALNAMAIAGGVPTGGSDPLATKYYLASTRTALVSALQAIAGDVQKTCVFTLEPAPPAPDFIVVKVSGNTIERDPSARDGWEYTNPEHTALQVYGASCEAIQKSVDSVEIVYGCQGVIPK